MSKDEMTQAYVYKRMHLDVVREARRWGMSQPKMYEMVIRIGLPEVQRQRIENARSALAHAGVS